MDPITQIQEKTVGPIICLKKLFQQLVSCFHIKQLLGMRKYKSKEPQVIPPQTKEMQGRKTLILDLDETLVHSSFVYIPDADFNATVKVGGINYKVYVRIRPGTEEFLKEMGKIYEVFIFTASLAEYANPVIDRIDTNKVCQFRLYREDCKIFNNLLVKDLSSLNRSINDVVIIDNSHHSFMLQPLNAIHIKNFFSDSTDSELYDLIPFLKLLENFQDVRPVSEWLQKFNHFQKFTFTNTLGERVLFSRNPDDDQQLQLRIESDKINSPMNLSHISEEEEFIKKISSKKLTFRNLANIEDMNEEEQQNIQARIVANINSPPPQNIDGIFMLQEDEADDEDQQLEVQSG